MDSFVQDVRSAKWVGIGLIVTGVLAILAPLLAGLAIAMSIGVLLLLAGALRTTFAVQAERGSARFHGFLAGGVALLCGAIMLFRPGAGLAFLTILLAIWFAFDGVVKISLAFQLRPDFGWGWTLLSGALTLALGLAVFFRWPLSGNWLIGTMVGIWGIFAGWALVNVAAAARRAVEAA